MRGIRQLTDDEAISELYAAGKTLLLEINNPGLPRPAKAVLAHIINPRFLQALRPFGITL